MSHSPSCPSSWGVQFALRLKIAAREMEYPQGLRGVLACVPSCSTDDDRHAPAVSQGRTAGSPWHTGSSTPLLIVWRIFASNRCGSTPMHELTTSAGRGAAVHSSTRESSKEAANGTVLDVSPDETAEVAVARMWNLSTCTCTSSDDALIPSSGCCNRSRSLCRRLRRLTCRQLLYYFLLSLFVIFTLLILGIVFRMLVALLSPRAHPRPNRY